MNLYPYTDGDKLEAPNSYFYSSFHGINFLGAWMASRDAALADLPQPDVPVRPAATIPEHPPYVLSELLNGIAGLVGSGAPEAEARALRLLANLVKRYEVTKRLHHSYSGDFRPIGPASLPTAYVDFGEELVRAYQHTDALLYLNTLLKIVDMLVSIRSRLPEADGARLAGLIMEERQAVRRVATRKAVCLES